MLRELIRLALEEERGVYKSLIVQAQSFADARIRVAQRSLSQRLPRIPAALNVELEQSALATWLSPLHPIDVILVGKGKNHLRAFRLVVDQRLIALARLAEEGESDRVKQGRFAGAIGPGNAGQLEVPEI